MHTHRRIIAISWLVFGVLILSVIGMNLGSDKTLVLTLGGVIGAIFVSAGFTLLANFRGSSQLCLPCSAISLFTFPVGTVIGLYYLWYYLKFDRVR
ncbi:MAG: hypothetical protein PHW66_05855 [Gallionella sp.]|jgi:hypothetical protein|nr:hypothetical protein [Gallionella sp.]